MSLCISDCVIVLSQDTQRSGAWHLLSERLSIHLSVSLSHL